MMRLGPPTEPVGNTVCCCTGKEYEARLRQQHSKLHPRTSWAAAADAAAQRKRRRGGYASDDEDEEGCGSD